MSKRIGRMTERITIIIPASTTSDGFHTTDDDEQTVGSCWAEVRPLTSRETEGTDVMRTESQFSVRTRYRTDFTTKMVIHWNDRVLSITSCDPDKLEDETRMTAVEVS